MLRVLVPKLLHLSNLIHCKADILGLPAVEGLLTDTHLPDQLGNRYSYLSLLENRYDLLHGKLLLHRQNIPALPGAGFAEILTFHLAQF